MRNRALSIIVVSTISLLCLAIVLTVCYVTVRGSAVNENGFQALRDWGLVLLGGLVGFLSPFRFSDSTERERRTDHQELDDNSDSRGRSSVAHALVPVIAVGLFATAALLMHFHA